MTLGNDEESMKNKLFISNKVSIAHIHKMLYVEHLTLGVVLFHFGSLASFCLSLSTILFISLASIFEIEFTP
jgi:hypothetical protein